MNNKLFNARAILTVAIGTAYIGSLVWAILHNKLDVQSFIAGLGPSFGVAIKTWFDGDAT